MKNVCEKIMSSKHNSFHNIAFNFIFVILKNVFSNFDNFVSALEEMCISDIFAGLLESNTSLSSHSSGTSSYTSNSYTTNSYTSNAYSNSSNDGCNNSSLVQDDIYEEFDAKVRSLMQVLCGVKNVLGEFLYWSERQSCWGEISLRCIETCEK